MSLGKKRMEEEAAAGGAASTEPEVIEKDDDERELDKLEKSDPEMLRICNIILDQLEKFKVRLTKIRLVLWFFLYDNNYLIVCLRLIILLLLTLHVLGLIRST